MNMKAMLEAYFTKRVGTKEGISGYTGERSSREVYKRRYTLEVVGVDSGQVVFQIKSVDHCPAGWESGGTSKRYGTIIVPIAGNAESTYLTAIAKADPEFIKRYAGKITWQ